MSTTTVTAASPSVELHNPAGLGPVVLLCEHASHHIPSLYNELGLDSAHRYSHAAWDPGSRDLALQLSQELDAPLIAGRVSRLVYDCNRPPEAASAMPERSEIIEVPGNRRLTLAQRHERIESVYRPFCNSVSRVIEPRIEQRHPTALVTVHSFTPDYHGRSRAVEIGVLHDADSRLADAILDQAPCLGHRNIQRNAPYGPEDGVTHSLKLHGISHDLPNVMLEIRNDLLTTQEDIRVMARELLQLLEPALTELGLTRSGPKGSNHA